MVLVALAHGSDCAACASRRTLGAGLLSVSAPSDGRVQGGIRTSACLPLVVINPLVNLANHAQVGLFVAAMQHMPK